MGMAERILAVAEALRDPAHPARRDPGMALIIARADHRFLHLNRRGGPSAARRTAVSEAEEALRAAFPDPEPSPGQ